MEIKSSPFFFRRKGIVVPEVKSIWCEDPPCTGGLNNFSEEDKALKVHKYGCLMTVLPLEIKNQITQWAIDNIPDDHLSDEGRESKPHITIKYGFKDSSLETVNYLKSFLAHQPPFKVRLAGVSQFKGNKDGDVFKIDVDGLDLHRLNKEVSQRFPCEDKYPKYIPHITIAYLNPENSDDYDLVVPDFVGQSVLIDRVEWSGTDGMREIIKLGNNKALSSLNETSGGALVGAVSPFRKARRIYSDSKSIKPSPFKQRFETSKEDDEEEKISLIADILEHTLGNQQTKNIQFKSLEWFVKHEIGEKWKGPSGRWFTRRQDGRVVPAKGDQIAEPTKKPKAEKPAPVAKKPKIEKPVKPKKEAKPKKIKIDVTSAKAKIDAIKAEGINDQNLNTLIQELKDGMTVVELQKLRKEIGAGTAKKKDEIVEKIKEVLNKPKKEIEKPVEVPDSDTIDLGELQNFDEPVPVSPMFTGVDTLGRHWKGGKPTGETTPPDYSGSQPKVKIDPTRKLNVKSLIGNNVAKLSQQDTDDLKSLGLLYNNGSVGYSSTNDYTSTPEKKAAGQRLFNQGLIESVYSFDTGFMGAMKISDKGKQSLILQLAGSDELADPLTLKDIGKYGNIFGLANEDQKKKIINHFGFKADEYFDLFSELSSSVRTYYNPVPMADKIRQNKNAQAVVNRLASVGKSTEEELDKFRERERAIEKEVKMPYGMIEHSITAYKNKLSNPGTKGKAKIKESLEKLEKAKKDLDESFEAKVKKRNELRSKTLDTVSNIFRENVTDPATFKVTHDTEVVPVAQERMNRAVELLQGVLQKGIEGDLKGFSTYRKEGDSRAHCTYDGKINFTASDSDTIGIHEIMHWVEMRNQDISDAIQEFRKYRVKDEKGTDMRAKYGNSYEEYEIGYKDNFEGATGSEGSAYYVGKHYNDSSTEMLTMGVQYLYQDPERFAKNDPEFTAFIVGMLDGSLRNKLIPRE